ncbi:hypothetical protein P9139_16270 [Curtobacterium flaccumfaciens]|nr:hypothetical protein P9139_16270 [Curtobacterium flaccumfaciens]
MARTAAWDRDELDDLADAGLTAVKGQTVTVRDPLVRSALYWRMPARDRRAAHTELAVASAECDPRASAWHRSFVDDVPTWSRCCVRLGPTSWTATPRRRSS